MELWTPLTLGAGLLAMAANEFVITETPPATPCHGLGTCCLALLARSVYTAAAPAACTVVDVRWLDEMALLAIDHV